MRVAGRSLAAVLALAAVCAGQQKPAEPEPPGDAILEVSSGTVEVRAAGGGQQRKLNRQNGNGTHLYAGDRLRCERNCAYTITLFGSGKQVQLGAKSGDYTVPAVRASNKSYQERLKLKGQFKYGARKRNLASAILSPRKDGAVLPSTFTFRWAQPAEGTLLLSLRLPHEDRPLWSSGVVEAAAREYVSEEARAALKQVQRKFPYALVEFSLTPAAGKAQKIFFRVLTRKEEAAVRRDLTRWERAAGLWRTIGRAYVFTSRQLFDEAAREYEAALEESPESRDLIRATVFAQCRAGNVARAAALVRRLPENLLPPEVNCAASPAR